MATERSLFLFFPREILDGPPAPPPCVRSGVAQRVRGDSFSRPSPLWAARRGTGPGLWLLRLPSAAAEAEVVLRPRRWRVRPEICTVVWICLPDHCRLRRKASLPTRLPPEGLQIICWKKSVDPVILMVKEKIFHCFSSFFQLSEILLENSP